MRRLALLVLASATALMSSVVPPAAAAHESHREHVPPGAATTIATFDLAAAELPETLVYRKGDAYLSSGLQGQILKIDYPSGERSVFAQLPVAPSSFTLGFEFDRAGNLFVAVAASDLSDPAGVEAAGIYRVPARGGTPVLWASGESTLKYASSLAFDRRGTLYVSDARDGTIYRFGREGAVGTAVPWLSDPTLTPDAATCPATSPFVLGVNGIVADGRDLWAVNTIQGTLLRIPVARSGAAGPVDVVVKDCSVLQGVDGLRPDPRSPRTHFLSANNFLDSIVSISRRGVTDVVASGRDTFQTPVDLAHITGTRRPARILVINSSARELFAGQPGRPTLIELALPRLSAGDRDGRAGH